MKKSTTLRGKTSQPRRLLGGARLLFCTTTLAPSFTALTGSAACQIAPGGFVTGLSATATGQTGGNAAGAVRLDACPPRYFRPSTVANNTCSLCAPGRETRRTSGATVCLACLAGSTLRSPSDVNCTRCSEGGRCDGAFDASLLSFGFSLRVCMSSDHMLHRASEQRGLSAQPAGTFRDQPNTSGACDPWCALGGRGCNACTPDGSMAKDWHCQGLPYGLVTSHELLCGCSPPGRAVNITGASICPECEPRHTWPCGLVLSICCPACQAGLICGTGQLCG